MEGRLKGLHPLKRLKLLHQQDNKETDGRLSLTRLPAKKRKDSWEKPSSLLIPAMTTGEATSCCLPAKKRIWAPVPLLNNCSPEKRNFSFDLNIEYAPSPEKNKKPIARQNEEEEEEEEKGVRESQGSDVVDDDDGIVCGVCQSTDGDPSDPIVLCDGCDVMVHASCYGYPLLTQGIPEGDWFCATCQQQVSSSSSSSGQECCCCLCPLKGGVVKPTVDDRWAHIICALLVPEVFFRDPEGREGIDCSRVPKRRWEEGCYICDSREGCAIQCSEPKCPLTFHVTCGLNEELCFEYKEGRSGRGGTVVAGFCKAHTELWTKQQQTGKFRIVAREENK